ncbi:MAG TPA: Smr/MutS family protein [Geobacteraceae bacterium]
MGKRRHQPTRPKEPSFKSTPFGVLKGAAVLPASPQPEPPPAAPQAAETDSDSDLFRRAMHDVRRLDTAPQTTRPGPRPHKPEPPSPVPPRGGEIDRADAEAFSRAIGQLQLDVTFADKFPEDEEIKPLGANRLRQLKKGIIRVDRQLDLHGLTRGEALEAIPRFLRNARVHGEKAVLVITGKGINSPGEPVLQQAVASWLRDAGREFVLEFAPAPREMGGSGAFVVFLRER